MSKEVNNPNSQNDVITTVTHALASFNTMVRTEMQNDPVFYDEDLSFDAALKNLISSHNYGN